MNPTFDDLMQEETGTLLDVAYFTALIIISLILQLNDFLL